MKPEPIFYTIEEVAKLFSVNRKTVGRWIRDGMLQAIKTPGGGKWLLYRREVDEKWTQASR